MTDIVSQMDLSLGQGAEFVQALVRQGLNSQGAQRLIESKILAAKVVQLLRGATETVSWSQAAAIMGDRAIGIAVATKLGLKLSSAKKTKYDKVPFSEAELEAAARQGYYLVAVPDVNLLDLRLAAGKFFWDQDWYQNQDFARAVAHAGYHLLRELPGSTSKNWSEQSVLQPSGFEAPMAVEMAYLAASWLALNRGVAFQNWVRTSDVVSDGGHVIVEIVDSRVYVGSNWDSDRFSGVAVASGQFRPLAS